MRSSLGSSSSRSESTGRNCAITIWNWMYQIQISQTPSWPEWRLGVREVAERSTEVACRIRRGFKAFPASFISLGFQEDGQEEATEDCSKREREITSNSALATVPLRRRPIWHALYRFRSWTFVRPRIREYKLANSVLQLGELQNIRPFIAA